MEPLEQMSGGDLPGGFPLVYRSEEAAGVDQAVQQTTTATEWSPPVVYYSARAVVLQLKSQCQGMGTRAFRGQSTTPDQSVWHLRFVQ